MSTIAMVWSVLMLAIGFSSCRPAKNKQNQPDISDPSLQDVQTDGNPYEVSYELDLKGQAGKKGDEIQIAGTTPKSIQVPEPVLAPGKEKGDESMVTFAATTPTFHSFFSSTFGRDAQFICPGNSLMTGQSTKYDPFTEEDELVQNGRVVATRDRVTKFVCRFLIDSNRAPLIRHNCKESKDFREDVIDYTCPVDAPYMAGQSSTYNKQTKDRSYKFKCCNLQTSDKNAVKIQNWPRDPFFPEEFEGEDPEDLSDNVPAPMCMTPAHSQRVFAANGQQLLIAQAFQHVNPINQAGEFDCENAGISRTSPRDKRNLNKVSFVSFGPNPFADPSAPKTSLSSVITRIRLELKQRPQDRVASYFCCSLTAGEPLIEEKQ